MNPLRVSDPKIKILRVIARLNIGGPAIHLKLIVLSFWITIRGKW